VAVAPAQGCRRAFGCSSRSGRCWGWPPRGAGRAARTPVDLGFSENGRHDLAPCPKIRNATQFLSTEVQSIRIPCEKSHMDVTIQHKRSSA